MLMNHQYGWLRIINWPFDELVAIFVDIRNLIIDGYTPLYDITMTINSSCLGTSNFGEVAGLSDKQNHLFTKTNWSMNTISNHALYSWMKQIHCWLSTHLFAIHQAASLKHHKSRSTKMNHLQGSSQIIVGRWLALPVVWYRMADDQRKDEPQPLYSPTWKARYVHPPSRTTICIYTNYISATTSTTIFSIWCFINITIEQPFTISIHQTYVI